MRLFQSTTKGNTMTINTFNALCQELTIPPEIALENDEIVNALRAKDDQLVVELLKTQF